MKEKFGLAIIVLVSFIVSTVQIAAADSRKSTDRAAEPETRVQSESKRKPAQPKTTVTVPKTEMKAAPKVKPKPAGPTKQGIAAPKSKVEKPSEVMNRTAPASVKKVNKLKFLKIKRVYGKNNNLHVVLHYVGREKLLPQDLIRAELIIRHGARTDVVFLRNKMAQLQQLGVSGRSVDIETGIMPKNEMVKVNIKGQRDAYTAKIAIKNTGPLEVPKKQMAAGSISTLEVPKKDLAGGVIPLKVPTEAAVLKDTGAVISRSKLFDVSLYKIEVYKQGWDEDLSYYEMFSKYPPSGNAPTSVTYRPSGSNNYVISFRIDEVRHSYLPMWFKVKACIQFKSSVKKNEFTLADYKKWSEPTEITWSLSLSGLPGKDIYKESKKGSPSLSMQYYDIFKESNNFLTTGGKGQPEICMEAEKTFYYSQFENIIPSRSTEVLYVEIEVQLDITHALDEPDESNNHTSEPVLAFQHSRPDLDLPLWQINLLRPTGSLKHNKWFIGTTKRIEWEESNTDERLRIDLYRWRAAEGGHQYVGTITDRIRPSSENSQAFTENYNWYDWRAGHLMYGGGDKVVEPNDPTHTDDYSDYYWFKFYALYPMLPFNTTSYRWRPLVMEGENKFTLNNFTKKFGNQVEPSVMKSPNFQITPGSQ